LVWGGARPPAAPILEAEVMRRARADKMLMIVTTIMSSMRVNPHSFLMEVLLNPSIFASV